MLLAILGCASLGAQDVPRRTLGKPSAELAEPFSAIGAIRELRDGRILAIDSRDRVLRLVDATLGAVSQVGGQGAGPGEYRVPGRLIALPGDSTLLTDAGNRRILLIGPTGAPGATLGAADQRGAWNPASHTPRYADAAGRVYFLGSPFAPGAEMQMLDTAAIIRVDRRAGTFDTVAFVRLPETRSKTTTAGGKLSSVEIFRNPFAAQDEWVVAPNGSVGIVRAAGYRAEWVAPDGTRRVGRAIPVTPIPITQRDRDDAVGRSGRTAARAGGQPAPPPQPAPDGPSVKPPFLRDGALAAPDGRLWVLRTRRAGDDVPVYDVFDATGRLAERVVLPIRGRVVGFGATSVYVARIDDDDLEYLQRVPVAGPRVP